MPVTLKKMTQEEFELWMEASIKDYADDLLESKQAASIEQAIENATSDFEELFVDGLNTKDTYIMNAFNEQNEKVGFISFETTLKARAFLEDFAVYEPYRRQGYGRQILEELEMILKASGTYNMVLHVFEKNRAARNLYEKLGFEYLDVVEVEDGSLYMKKSLADDRLKKIEDTNKVKALFDGWEETLIWSCMDGTMGGVYGKDANAPESVLAWLGDFGFLAGKPDKEIVAKKPEGCQQEFIILVPQNEEWAKAIEDVYLDKAKRVTRYAIKKESKGFDLIKLKKAVASLSSEYELKEFDQDIFEYAKKHEWTCDWCSQFKDYETYKKLGLGYVICKDGEIIAGASSYSSYKGGIEIEIDTKEEYRRKGLGFCCAARLILECLDRGLYPSWDAANMNSVGLAKKLGYQFDHEYAAYFVYGY